MPSSRRSLLSSGVSESAGLLAMQEDDVFRYDVTDWSLDATYSALACGLQGDQPRSRIVVNPDKTWFAVNGASGTVVIRISDGAQLYFNSLCECQCDVSPDGETLVITSNSNFYRVDTTAWTISAATDTGVSIYTCTRFSHDGAYIVFCDYIGDMMIFDTSDWSQYSSLFAGLGGYGSMLEWSDDDSRILSTSHQAAATELVMAYAGTTMTLDWMRQSVDEVASGYFYSNTQVLVDAATSFHLGGMRLLDEGTGAEDLASTDTGASTGDICGSALNADKTVGVAAMFAAGGKLFEFDPSTLDYVGPVDDSFGTGYRCRTLAFY